MPLSYALRFEQALLRMLSLALPATVSAPSVLGRYIALAQLLLVLAAFAPSLHAQTTPLITTPVDETRLVTLRGSRPAQLKNAKDLGKADQSQRSGRLMLVLKRSDEQEGSLQNFLQSAHQSSSPSFHKWLAPGEFGTRFGTADSDIQQVTAWMQSHGLTVTKVSSGKSTIEFSGSIGQVNEAFHTSIHKYSVNGETHYANAADPQVPAAFSALVAGVTQLNDFKPKPMYKLAGQALYNPKTHKGIPQWTFSDGAGEPPIYLLTPEDFATQYDLKPLQAAHVNGAGQTIGIINDSNIDINLVNAYRKLFGLPPNPPQVVIDGNDPGINGDAIEAYLDVENSGAIAPAATVKLYIAGSYGLLGAGGIEFSLVRAVDDDAASILSLSFESCESSGTAANQFINAAWEQAAAQGQTVMVSAGDSGSASGCLYVGLGVNGFASTPWDVAVGGTDAYFSDYASGGASIAGYWSNTNDANLGSLQKPMSEQPWNGSQFGLNSTTYDPVADQPSTGGAGGGGASSCAVGSFVILDGILEVPTCTSGYPKPSWQVGPGVPSDTVRDLPDVSLFASNGVNGVLWPICATAGDCTETSPATDETLIAGVGGTSASAPAMAGILALIEQKYGPQGQANYTLYPLAVQSPTVFNDITVGSNNQPCILGLVAFGLETGCSADTDGDGFDSLQHYYAASGYDQASGLGSLDVNQLYNHWGRLTYAKSTTKLSLTPAAITHGQSVLADVTVTGNRIPSGPVALVSSTTLPNNKGIGALVLGSNGSVQQQLTSFPGGSYTVTAEYNGDGINGPSKSQPVSVTVAPEASVLTFSPTYVSYNGTTAAADPITAGLSVNYGSSLLFDVSIAGASGVPGAPTGTVTFSDGSTTLGTVAVNAGGAAEFNASMLSPGSHTISARYSGDASYKASKTAPLQFRVVQVMTTLDIFPDASQLSSYFLPTPPNLTFYYNTGQSPDFEAVVLGNTTFAGALPTGTMTFRLGSNARATTVPIITADDILIDVPTAGATQFYPNVQAGTYPLTVTYNGDANYAPASVTYTVVVTPGTLLPTTTTLKTNPTNLSNIPPSTLVTLTMTVTGSGTAAPTGTAGFVFADIEFLEKVQLVPGTGNTSTATVTVLASELEPGNDVIDAAYFGNSTYAGSASAATTIYDNPTDFAFSTLTPNLAIQPGSTGTATLSLGSVNGFNGTVALTCAAPRSMICTIANPWVRLNGTTTANVTITDQCRRGREGSNDFIDTPACREERSYHGDADDSHNVVVTGTSFTGIVHNTTITVIVQ